MTAEQPEKATVGKAERHVIQRRRGAIDLCQMFDTHLGHQRSPPKFE